MLSVVNPENPPLAALFGLSGTTLSADEKAFFKQADPLGFILFARNCESPEQLKALTASLQDLLGRTVPILIDQEGGRVRRLKPPQWHYISTARSFGESAEKNIEQGLSALNEAIDAMAADLNAGGINVNCAPVLDVLHPETHDSIGDRAYSADPALVGRLGAAVCERLLQHHIIPVIKHLPGQGRAASDSHHDLPVVSASLESLEQVDFAPFEHILRKVFSACVWGMVSHVVYPALDERAPASCSRRVIYDTIRARIGFRGFLLSDDISMGALESMGHDGLRAEKVLRAGCDAALHCNGEMADMEKVAARAQKMTNEAVTRYNSTLSWMEEAVA